MKENVKNELIENFLMGRLTEEEMQSFRLQMDQDPELRNAVKNHQTLLNQIDELYDYQASKLIKKVQQDAKSNQSGKSIFNKRLIWVFAVAVITVLLFFIINQSTHSSNEKLYASYYEPYSINFVQRGVVIDKNIVDAGSYYMEAEYSQALPLLTSAFSKDPTHTHVQMAIGICQHELNRFENAIQTFKPLIENQDPLYFDQASWYSALAHLRLDQIKQCKELLDKISQSNSSKFKESAQSLLAELN